MSNALTVKNTFIEFDECSSEPPDESGRGRASSDPGTLDATCSKDVSAHEAEAGAHDIVLTGLEVASTAVEDELDIGRLSIGVSRSTSGSDSSRRRRDDQQTADLDDPELVQLQQDIERLAMENKRLEESNKVLQEACRAKSAALPCGAVGVQEAIPGAMQNYVQFVVPMMPQVQQAQQPQQASVGPQGQSQQVKSRGKRPQLPQPQRPGRLEQSGTMVNAESANVASSSAQESVPLEQRTTVMLRNLPNNYTSDMLIEMINSEGFQGKYDFVYLPMDFSSYACLGYAFVNLIEPADALRFCAAFDGFSKWAIPSKKQCYVSWSNPHQGLEANIHRYKNSPVMHESVPEEFRPRLWKDGVPVPFPEASRKLRAPRLRR
eukprot:TRINITY_DN4829_c0_g1_i1.p1 TRINITY_DN4829_c0_g1~~TRINITY_DN4829_c0_g1_i1.p1  ORF type:complete len:396 (-),score=63.07 TRINITY_DN4829_c0_g1_i1:107-1240(-)